MRTALLLVFAAISVVALVKLFPQCLGVDDAYVRDNMLNRTLQELSLFRRPGSPGTRGRSSPSPCRRSRKRPVRSYKDAAATKIALRPCRRHCSWKASPGRLPNTRGSLSCRKERPRRIAPAGSLFKPHEIVRQAVNP
jgi:hypothetical protein